MKEEEEETERNINNITCNTSFQSPMNVQNKDSNTSLERRLASGVLTEMVENFKGCTIQSTIRDSAHIDSDKQVDEINDSEEQVDARNWLRNDSTEQFDAIINNSDKQVDTIRYSEKLVVDGSDPKSDPRVATHNTNRISDTHTTNGISTQKLLINPTIQVVVRLITPLVTAGVVGTRESLKMRQTVLPQANVTDGCTFARVFTGVLGR